MTDANEGTPSVTEEAPVTPVTPPTPDEVTTLRSRNAGLDAKVTELTKTVSSAQAQAVEAAKKLADYEAGKVNADEALRAQLAEKDAELATTRREAQMARIEASYPETFKVLGDAAASLSADKLADAEARFTGVAAASETPAPKPIGNNGPRTNENPTPQTAKERLAAKEALFRTLQPDFTLD